MRCLLDVNILIALLDADHLFHTRVHEWLGDHTAKHKAKQTGGLATCALTQNGAIRIMSQSRYSSRVALKPAQVKLQLQLGLAGQDHEFWTCEASLLDDQQFDWPRIHAHGQLTDIYLLGLAVHLNGCLVTLDRNIALSAVHGAKPKNILVL